MQWHGVKFDSSFPDPSQRMSYSRIRRLDPNLDIRSALLSRIRLVSYYQSLRRLLQERFFPLQAKPSVHLFRVAHIPELCLQKG